MESKFSQIRSLTPFHPSLLEHLACTSLLSTKSLNCAIGAFFIHLLFLGFFPVFSLKKKICCVTVTFMKRLTPVPVSTSIMLPCYGRTPHEHSRVAKFTSMKCLFLRKVVNIFPLSFQNHLVALRRKLSEKLGG